MRYSIPTMSADLDLSDNLKNIEKTIDNLNKRRDTGLDPELEQRLKKHLLISSVYNSNAIEGNKLSLRETEIILEGMSINERPLKDEIEAKSLSNATSYLYDLINGSEPLNKRCLFDLHSLLMENIPNMKAGVFRNEEVTIKNSEHVPISWLHVTEEIESMFRWMNRNMHKYNPVVMCSILHHWLVWIHPFSDGNGRVTRLFTNFFLLQKGYPEIVVKIGDRDNYYNALIDADKGNITKLVDLFCDKIRQTVAVYEGFLNEHDRQIAWKQRYQNLVEDKYSEAKETFSYQYEVWKDQLNVFKTILLKNVETLDKILPHIAFEIKEYDILTYEQYLDILEDRKVSNTWYFVLSIFNQENQKKMNFVFYFERLKVIEKANLAEADKKTQKPHVKLFVVGRKHSESIRLGRSIDLVNVGTHRDELSFGVHNKKWDIKLGNKNPKGSIITVKENPNKMARIFLDQILYKYFDVNKKKKATNL
ncbi:MAG: Fic family protein [Flavobacterium sp.]